MVNGMWLVIRRHQKEKDPVVCFNGNEPPKKRRKSAYLWDSEFKAGRDADSLTGAFLDKHGYTYKAEEWPSMKAAKAAGYRFA
jgi:hypothetical protein